jgi:DNA-binding NarL/FixJ family response regulator
MRRTTLILADDSAVIVEALGKLLHRDYEILASVGDGEKLIEAAVRLRPDVVVADMNMPAASGLQALRRLKAAGVDTKFVFLTMDGDNALAFEAFHAGGSAYLLKHSATEELHTAIQEVIQGRTYLTAQIAEGIVARLSSG